MIWKPWGYHPKGTPVLAGWRYPDMWRFAVAMEETGRRAGRIYAGLSDVTDEPPDVFAEIILPDTEAAARIDRALVAYEPMLEILKTTAGNIRSLGPAGALGPVFREYEVWLAEVDAAIAKAGG